MNQICLVCYANMIEAPNGVCMVCYEKLKKEYFHSREYWEEYVNAYQTRQLKPEIFEKNVTNYINFEDEDWNEVSKDGLSAVQVFIDILDSVDINVIWHKRRVHFMKDMVERLDKGYFTPANQQQVADFVQSSIDFWNGKISKKEAKDIYDKMRGILQKKDITEWDSKSFLLWMIEEKEQFDWMWEQWFGCLRECIPNPYNDSLWIELFQKHFPDEIQAWVYNE
ncbi:MAG: hypothetical protein E6767_20430 [Dysgonomonas sp.]|nr:hypothetical protein [Dysgonomonas sp.]